MKVSAWIFAVLIAFPTFATDENSRLVEELRTLSQEFRTELHSIPAEQLPDLVRAQATVNSNELNALRGNLTTNQLRYAIAEMKHDLTALEHGNTKNLIATLHTATDGHQPADLFPEIDGDQTTSLPQPTRAARRPASDPPADPAPVQPPGEGVGTAQ